MGETILFAAAIILMGALGYVLGFLNGSAHALNAIQTLRDYMRKAEIAAALGGKTDEQ